MSKEYVSPRDAERYKDGELQSHVINERPVKGCVGWPWCRRLRYSGADGSFIGEERLELNAP